MKKPTHIEFLELGDKLMEYAEIEGSELGDVGKDLVQLGGSTTYLSDEFNLALFKEMQEHLKWFEEEMEIVTEDRTYTVKETFLRDKE